MHAPTLSAQLLLLAAALSIYALPPGAQGTGFPGRGFTPQVVAGGSGGGTGGYSATKPSTAAAGSVRRSAAAASDDVNGRDYWERLVGTPSRLGGKTRKTGVLPVSKYDVENFDVLPFQMWLRDNAVLSTTSVATKAKTSPRPLSYVCGVFINPVYKFIFIRNRKTASTTFLAAIKRFMLMKNLCNVSSDPLAMNSCMYQMNPEALLREGKDPDAMWRDYLVISSSRNAWARAASGYEFTFDQWRRKDGVCSKPTFGQFCRDPHVMGKLSNMFMCMDLCEGVQRFDSTQTWEFTWAFNFHHVEPAAGCMVDNDGELVVDFIIRYERLHTDMQAAVDLINSRRESGLPAITLDEVKWHNKGPLLKQANIGKLTDAVKAYAPKYRECGFPCVQSLSDFLASDLELFGWDRPGPPPVKT